MAKKKNPSLAALVAAANIAIDGRHFGAGEEVTGVDAEQLRLSVSSRRVITAGEYMNRGVPAPAAAEEGNADPAEDSTGEAPEASSQPA